MKTGKIKREKKLITEANQLRMKLFDAAMSLDLIRVQLEDMERFCRDSYDVVNNNFINTMVEHQRKKIRKMISTIHETIAWEDKYGN